MSYKNEMRLEITRYNFFLYYKNASRHKIYFYCPQKITEHHDDDAVMNCDHLSRLTSLTFLCVANFLPTRAERGSFKSFLNSRMKMDYFKNSLN